MPALNPIDMLFRSATVLAIALACASLFSCNTDKDDDDPLPTGPALKFVFKFDKDQERLNNFGQPTGIGQGNAAQTPDFRKMAAHYVEMVTSAWTQVGEGQVLYHAPETTIGGNKAIDFSKSVTVAEGETFLSVPLKDIAAGTYPFIRVSISYQEYDIKFNATGYNQLTGTLASFLGYNTYIGKYTFAGQQVTVNANKRQGYWGFVTIVPTYPGYPDYVSVVQGDVPEGAITVPNVLAASSPIPNGSCLVTGNFESPLIITGNETEDITVRISISVNNSFEWSDPDGNGQYDPQSGDVPVDMGVRGLKAFVLN